MNWPVVKRTPFEEGQAAASNPYATWFDCPYRGADGPVQQYNRDEWFRGWDSVRRPHSIVLENQ